MLEPYPLRSTHNPSPPGPVDYNMASPLKPDGSDFPCKGFGSDIGSVPAVQEYKAGETYTMTLGGGASHEGGSCQLSLSYDQGKSFHVIHSMIGGCPLQTSYKFTIPSDAPSCAKALFSWSWVNKVGNREFYMNCAVVKITGSSSGTTLSTPMMFEANIFSGTCQTPEGVDFVYPNPGDSVEYGGSYAAGSKPPPTTISGCPSVDNAGSPPSPPEFNNTAVQSPAGSPVGSPSMAPKYIPTSSSHVAYPTISNNAGKYQQPHSSSVVGAATETDYVTVTRTSVDYVTRPRNSATPTASGGSAVDNCDEPGVISCASDGRSWKFCDYNKHWQYMQCSKSEVCRNGELIQY